MAEEISIAEARKGRDRGIKAVNKILHELHHLHDIREETPLSIPMLKSKAFDLSFHIKQVKTNVAILLENETDEEKLEEDERIETAFENNSSESQLCNDLTYERQARTLMEAASDDITSIEMRIAADTSISFTECLPTIQKQLDEAWARLTDSTIPAKDESWTTLKLLKQKLVSLRIHKIVEVKPLTVVKSEYETDFKIPKVNIPKFKGGVEVWHAFWNRFKTAVVENPKLSEPVKLAFS